MTKLLADDADANGAEGASEAEGANAAEADEIADAIGVAAAETMVGDLRGSVGKDD